MPKVSVIIPIYKAEKTLDRCIKSLQAQTHTDWEAICVNDGSPDNCGTLLDEYAKVDPRIKPIHKENGGVASARQYGIEVAIGDYAIHCDPDDWVESNMLELLVNEAERSGAGMVICDYFTEQNGCTKYVEQRPTELTARDVEIGLFQRLHGSCCNKLISSAYYKRESFIQGLNLSEDLLYICKILRHNPKVSYLPLAFYHYMLSNNGSMSTTFTSEKYWQLVNIYRELLKLYINESTIYNRIIQSRALSISYIGAMAEGVRGKDVRKELGNVVGLIWNSNTSMFRKVIMIATVLDCKPLAALLITMKAMLAK